VLPGVALLLLFGCAQSARAAIAINQITDINNTGTGFGQVNVFSNPPIGVNDTGVYMNNDVTVYTLVGGGASNGAGVAVGISNGENGFTSTVGLPDPDNATPADSIFTAIGNASGRLENGNAIRLSMWMRQDPTNPVTKQPSVEPVVKIELWKQALSGMADFNPVAFPGSGDRIWDTDQNASNAVFVGHNQSQASWVDMNNNGVIAPSGKTLTVSLVTDEWRRVEATLIVDDDPLDDGLGWSIGPEFYDVTTVEEVRAVMFVGDFAGTDLTNGGSFFVDNLMVEVFADQAAMLATPNPNTMPVEVAGLPGDYNGNDIVDAADFTVWRDRLGQNTPLDNTDPNDTDGMVTMAEYTFWKNSFGNSGSGSLGVGNVPEPATLLLAIVIVLGSAFLHRRQRLAL
jgi:hypothetical protein